jgi:sulfur relay (sulfurtransferase) complex TusBCD TusD component (DsrE family)
MSGVALAVCDASLAARGIAEDELILGAIASPMSLLADWALAADRVVAF